jgi:hypothetical protein
MPIQLTDTEIAKLLIERKPLPSDYQERMVTKPKRGHKERELDIKGVDGNEFRVILRQSLFNPLDFSVILAYRVPTTNQLFRLRRYNGKSHEHSNKLEGVTFYTFHIHKATERYQQESGLREDSFAEATDRYSDFNGAIRCMLEDGAVDVPADPQLDLFREDA